MNPSTFRLLPSLFVILLITALSLGSAVSAQGQEVAGGIRRAMSPEEFRAAGLEKLTAAELERLDAFLQGDRAKTVEKAQKAAKREKLQLVVSRVDGEITGIAPRQIIVLEDGSKWQVAKTDFQFRGHVDHPAAAAFKTFFGWKMRIAGVAELYVVPVGRR